jgi:transcriptional regulator of acetoin/glycerol metabolism
MAGSIKKPSSQKGTTVPLEPPQSEADVRSTGAIRWLCPGASATYTRLVGDQLTLGRNDTADVSFETEGVSRDHARITRQGPVYSVADAGSTNGTYLNGQRVRHAVLALNDVLRLGDMLGIVLRLPANVDVEASDLTEVSPGVVFGPGLGAELEMLRRSAKSNLPIVLIGETGVGKERLARLVHDSSGRSGPFHAVNCAALPTSLAEAELFGYRKGAFTGAEQPALGHFRAARGGTLLLDELADLSAPVQAKLLRALQESEITPLGETRGISVDVRVVTACQVPLIELVRSGRLREDLMMRLSGIALTIPPLRSRRVDAALMVEHFLEEFGQEPIPIIEARALEALLLHPWPGNVRELELLSRQLLTLHGHEPVLRCHMLPDSMNRAAESVIPRRGPEPEDAALTRNQHDLENLVLELKRNGGNVARAATAIGISRQRAYRVLAGQKPEELMLEVEAPAEPKKS